MNYIILLIVVILLGYLIYIYNRLVRLQTLAVEAWSGIDVQLQKRHDLIPNIVKTVQAYQVHEKNLLEEITKLRADGIKTNEVDQLEHIEVKLSQSLGKLFVVVENYPELKASENFLELQKELSKVENDLQKARRYYNGSVRNYNILVEQFPSNVIAKAFNHQQKKFFDLQNETEKAMPTINFNS
ncbi:MAG TPA: LemA family protein [Flavobacteriaceae bacterium]|nr:LemA family protein [Flavobacteriaceae bacterium]